MFAEWSRSLSFLRTVEVLLWAVYVSQCLFLRSTRQHQLCAAALAGPNYRARCWSWTFCLSTIYLLYPGNDTAKSARSHRLLSLAWVNICLHFRNLFWGQTVKPSEFPITDRSKNKAEGASSLFTVQRGEMYRRPSLRGGRYFCHLTPG